MTIYIVLKNGEIDAAFTTREVAELHRKNIALGWNITNIVEITLYEF
jgi:hypothetical protein